MNGPTIELSRATLAPFWCPSRIVLENCSTAIEGGKITALMGGSGCGKTTLLRALVGFNPLQRGSISWKFDGRTVNRASLRTSFMFQDARCNVLPWKSVRDNVEFPSRLRSQPFNADKYLAALGLTDLAENLPMFLSGGERKRLALAVAMSYQPQVLVLDEPTAGLDFDLAMKVLDFIEGYHRNTGATIIMVMHSPLEAACIASRVLVLSRRALSGLELENTPPSAATLKELERTRDSKTKTREDLILQQLTPLLNQRP